jgi:hypothetical protein
MAVQSHLDADFYSVAHNVIHTAIERENETRRAVRESFDGDQLIATCRKGQPVVPADFRRVRCQDLSVDGMSYFDDSPPPSGQQFMVLLGTNPTVCLIGQIMNHSTVKGDKGPEFLIDCQFIHRMQ